MPELLFDKIARRAPGICLYGFAPPKRTSSHAELNAIAAQHVERLSLLAPDGVIIYDIQDEAGRTQEARPFPFLPTVAPQEYANEHLRALELPKVVYRCVNGDSRETFLRWLTSEPRAPALSVLVGAPSHKSTAGLSLSEAYGLAQQHAPQLTVGGITIAERHQRHQNEHERMLAKTAAGCRFFVTQAVYDVSSTLSLVSDYSLALAAASSPAVPLILTFSPCGSLKTLTFMKWLGIQFPRWLENELRYATNPLQTSLNLCERIFREAWGYAQSKGIPLGVNVESVSIRKSEIDASFELANTLRTIMAA
jgi:Methylenetetrahydrofolate reductase